MNDSDSFLKRLESIEKKAVALFLLAGKLIGMIALLGALLLLELALVTDIWTYKFSSAPAGIECKACKRPAGRNRHCVCSNTKTRAKEAISDTQTIHPNLPYQNESSSK